MIQVLPGTCSYPLIREFVLTFISGGGWRKVGLGERMAWKHSKLVRCLLTVFQTLIIRMNRLTEQVHHCEYCYGWWDERIRWLVCWNTGWPQVWLRILHTTSRLIYSVSCLCQWCVFITWLVYATIGSINQYNRSKLSSWALLALQVSVYCILSGKSRQFQKGGHRLLQLLLVAHRWNRELCSNRQYMMRLLLPPPTQARQVLGIKAFKCSVSYELIRRNIPASRSASSISSGTAYDRPSDSCISFACSSMSSIS